jgi:hypothetical protein
MAKTALELFVEKSDFEGLVKHYRRLSKVRDAIASDAKNVPNNALDPIVHHLDDTLRQYREGANQITGYDITHEQLTMPSLGFGAATGATRQRPFGADVPEQYVAQAQTGAQAADQLPPIGTGDIPPALLEAGDAGELAQFVYDYDAQQVGAHGPAPVAVLAPGGQEFTGFLAGNGKWFLGGSVLIGAFALALAAFFILGDCGSDDGGGGSTAVDTNGEAVSIWSAWPQATQDDFGTGLPYLSSEVTPIIGDPLDDAFTAFGNPATFESPHGELLGAQAYNGILSSALFLELAQSECGYQFENGTSVHCPNGASGPLPDGTFILTAINIDGDLTQRDPTLDYGYSFLFADPGDAVAPTRQGLPLDPVQGTNRYFTALAEGTDQEWQLTGRYFDPAQGTYADMAQSQEYTSILANTRVVVGSHSVALIVPAELCPDPACRFNSGAGVHILGQEFTPDNHSTDTIGADPTTGLPPIVDLSGGASAQNPTGEPAVTSTVAGPPPTATPLTAAEAAAIFEGLLVPYIAAQRTGDEAYLSSHVHQSAIDHWGQAQCDAFFAGVQPDPTFSVVIHSVAPPAPWQWTIYGQDVGTIPDAYTLDVTLNQGGGTITTQIHMTLNENQDLKFFSPCQPPPQ